VTKHLVFWLLNISLYAVKSDFVVLIAVDHTKSIINFDCIPFLVSFFNEGTKLKQIPKGKSKKEVKKPMVKLSTLNKYKGKLVSITAWNDEDKETFEIEGTITDINEDKLTIEYADEYGEGFEVIAIEDIRSLSEKKT